MSQKLFQASCTVLWGPQYRSEAARQLGVSLRGLMRYDAGDRAVPPVLLARLAKLLEQRQAAIAKLLPKVVVAGDVEG
jgi:hypothetical protein